VIQGLIHPDPESLEEISIEKYRCKNTKENG